MPVPPRLNAPQIPVTGSYSRFGAPVVTLIQLVHPQHSQGARQRTPFPQHNPI
jgi:hypothetical protein